MRRRSSIAANPLLIGALTTLIASVAVFISYNANNGLPFVPTYQIRAELREGYGLQPSNQVRISGTRVGIVEKIVPRIDPATGRVTAVAYLKLEKSVEPLPADTITNVQSVSSVGLKYLELTKGRSRRTIPQGGRIPIVNSREPVQIEDLFNMFDKKTREANQQNLITFGDAFAGRGIGLNETIAALRPLARRAVPVLRNLASPQTGLRNLFLALQRAASETAPVAETQAQFYSDLDTTFSALAGVAPQIEETIVGGPPALRQAIHSFPFQAPFVEKTTEFFRLLRPSARALRTAAPALGKAFAAGSTSLREAEGLFPQLSKALQATQAFAQDPVVTLGLQDLTETAQAAGPIAAGLAPAQITCNYFTLFFRNFSSLLSLGNGVGTLLRFQAVLNPLGPNNEGGPSSAPANGPSEHVLPTETVDNNHLHSNPYPNVAGPGQPKLCEAGNETYTPGKATIGNLPPSKVTAGRDTTTREPGLGAPEAPVKGSAR
jgi:ABC-type transporter Mla subunit MlaD